MAQQEISQYLVVQRRHQHQGSRKAFWEKDHYDSAPVPCEFHPGDSFTKQPFAKGSSTTGPAKFQGHERVLQSTLCCKSLSAKRVPLQELSLTTAGHMKVWPCSKLRLTAFLQNASYASFPTEHFQRVIIAGFGHSYPYWSDTEVHVTSIGDGLISAGGKRWQDTCSRSHADLPMMMHSLLPAMNMEAVLEGKLKCRAAKKGERRSEGSAGTLPEGRVLEAGEARSSGFEPAVASSGCLMITHT